MHKTFTFLDKYLTQEIQYTKVDLKRTKQKNETLQCVWLINFI